MKTMYVPLYVTAVAQTMDLEAIECVKKNVHRKLLNRFLANDTLDLLQKLQNIDILDYELIKCNIE